MFWVKCDVSDFGLSPSAPLGFTRPPELLYAAIVSQR